MKKTLTTLLLILATYLAIAQNNYRERISFDDDWLFAYGHPTDVTKDFNTGTAYFTYLAKARYGGDGATVVNFDDRAWRKLDLPHDWAVEAPFDAKGSHSHGYKAIGRNFPDACVGWYRKHFTISKEEFSKEIFIDFDGVFRDAKVWVNGHYLGNEPSGYQSFSFNITDILNYGEDNIVAVRADVSMEEGWFYEGAGIYRHVWMRKTNPLHVPKDGTFVYSDVNGNKALVNIECEIENRSKKTVNAILRHTIVDTNGKEHKNTEAKVENMAPMEKGNFKAKIDFENPILWSLENPYLYTMKTQILVDGKIVDEYNTKFGIRTIKFDADKGFFLNGKHVKLKGTNNHQEHAGVGAAMPDELIVYRMKLLKSFGSNAYRSSHNPPTPELLDICDSLGILVIDENRLMGTTENALNEFARLIKRDRNHPSVIVWSAGNEEWGIEGNEIGARMALTMQNFAKTIDPTRPVNVAISGGWGYGISTTIETMGFNYLIHGNTDEYHKNFPNTPCIGTEEGSTFASRGEYFKDDKKQYLPAYDLLPRKEWYTIEQVWQHYDARDYLSGMFIWTGFDYRGESTPYSWPSVLSYFGMMDLCGFPKDNVYYLKSWWQNEPVLHILPHWNWEGKEGDTIDVWVHSNCDEVELFLNKKSLGKKKMQKNSHLEWKVPYKKGTLKTIGRKNGKIILTKEVKTTGSPTQLALEANKQTLKADNRDVSVITVKALDKKGNEVPIADNQIQLSITGPAKIIGVGNGNQTSHENEKFIDEIEIIEFPELTILELNIENIQEYMQGLSAEMKNKLTSDSIKKLMVANYEIKKLNKSSKTKLFFNQVGINQAIYINGNLISGNISDDKSWLEFEVDNKYLLQGENKIVVIATPLKKKHQWDNPNKKPGNLQIVTKAAQWCRKLYNGLAQVIIQSTHQKGKVVLNATSEGVEQASFEFIVE